MHLRHPHVFPAQVRVDVIFCCCKWLRTTNRGEPQQYQGPIPHGLGALHASCADSHYKPFLFVVRMGNKCIVGVGFDVR